MQLAELQVRLTVRESQIAALVCEGLTNEEISEVLKISPSTVKTHLKGLFAGLGISKREQLIAWCMTYPEAFNREWASVLRHVRGCDCRREWCSAMRSAPERAA